MPQVYLGSKKIIYSFYDLYNSLICLIDDIEKKQNQCEKYI